MANRLVKLDRIERTRVADDMPRRNDLLVTNPEIFTEIAAKEMAASPISFLGRIFGDQQAATDDMFTLNTMGIGTEYIRIKEYFEKYEAIRIVSNDKVPATIVPFEPFEVGLDYPLDEDDQFFTKRGDLQFRVTSRRPGPNGHDHTVILDDSLAGSVASAAIFGINDPINHGIGNSKGEGSYNSNMFVGDPLQERSFFNPMKITRRYFPVTGSAMGDESAYYQVTIQNQNTQAVQDHLLEVPYRFIKQVMNEMSYQFMYSRANFDPQTLTILGKSPNGKYPERPSFSGVWQQLQEGARMTITHSIKSETKKQLMAKVDNILRQIYYKTGQRAMVFAMCKGLSADLLRDAIRSAIDWKYNMKIEVTPSNDKLKVGFELDDYITDHGRLVVYDIGAGLDLSGYEFEKVQYNGIVGDKYKDTDIFFMVPSVMGKDGGKKMRVKLYHKETNRGRYGRVSRGFVFGMSKGLTGQNNNLTTDQLLNIQDQTIDRLMSNTTNRIDSLVDGDEYHVLYQHTPYINVDNVFRMKLLF